MMQARTIQSKPARLTTVAVSAEDLSDAAAWLQAQAVRHSLRWLLAYLDDGVVWGRVNEGQLRTSYDAAQGHPAAEPSCPPLRLAVLQQARLFAEAGELLLWRDGDNTWQARLIAACSPEEATWQDALDEEYLLLGSPDADAPLPGGFTLFRDGAQGLRHVAPLPLEVFGGQSRPRLVVRQYLAQEPFARIVASRLVDLAWEGNP